MARRIYSRRITEMSWVDASAKPDRTPLRYRISPIDKRFDALEKLEAELEKQIDKLDAETYDEYSSILETRRAKLEAARRKERGEPPEPSLKLHIKLRAKSVQSKANARHRGLQGAAITVILFVIFIVFGC